MLSPDSDYRQILKAEFANRARSNPLYSMRAFAKFLGLSSAALSDIFNARYGISAQKAEQFANRLGYSPKETELFCILVEKEHARSQSKREAAQLRLEKFRSPGSLGAYQTLQDDMFQAISHWFHFSIVELTRTRGFQSNTAWIGKRLGISTIEADLAIQRLIRMGLLEDVAGKLIPSQDFYGSHSSTPSEARKSFHAQIMSKAALALGQQLPEKRDFSATILAIDPSKIGVVREMAEEFRLKVDALMQSSSSYSEVYCLAVQFFNLGEDQNEKAS